MNGLNNMAVADYRKAVTGKDGQLFMTDSRGQNHFLGEVDTFQIQVNVANADWQPVGSILNFALGTGVTVTLSFTETVIRDEFTIAPFLEGLRNGIFPLFAFQGALRRRPDAPGGEVGRRERVVLSNCTPDGAIDIMSLTPGEIVKRAWSFRVNSLPKELELFI
ncbi:MAG: phage tail tube protein [Oscillospiraceae bacterium]|nr:phage tail tube protein [Oscillospiraceae bacterium]